MNSGDRPRGGGIVEDLEEVRRLFAQTLQESDRRGAQRLLRGAFAAGHNPSWLLREVVSPAIEAISQRWTEHVMSLSQIYVAGLMVKDSTELLSPGPVAGESPIGKVVIGVAEGDHHGLGKVIVSAFLRSAGFAVVDLGLTVAPKAFVDAALAEDADIIAISALMVDPALRIREVREEMKRRWAEKIRLLVGGAPFRYNPKLYEVVGADATAPTAYEAIAVAKRLLEGRDGGQ